MFYKFNNLDIFFILNLLVVAFENIQLRGVCENKDLAMEAIGTTKLLDRLADIFAATSVCDLLVGDPKETVYGSLPAYQIKISDEHVLFFFQNHVNPPCLENGKLDWLRVSRIKIVAIQKISE